jgi:uncharacterized membrane protein
MLGRDLTVASGSSADGNTIVGWSTRNGNPEAFVAVVPEPSGLALLTLAVPVLLRQRRRRRSIPRLVCTLGAVAAALAGAASTASAGAILMPLGKLPGGVNSVATGVSFDGSTVVGRNSSNSSFEGFPLEGRSRNGRTARLARWQLR